MKDLIKKYGKRLKKEQFVKSLIDSLSIAFIISSIIPIIGLILNAKVWIYTLIVFVVAWVTTFIILYFFIYKVTEKDIFVRLDSLGLDERAITMYEYGETDSFMCQVQKEDALKKINTIQPMDIKLTFFKRALIILLITVFISMNLNVVQVKVYTDNNQPVVFPVIDETPTESKEDIIIEKLVDRLIEIINQADINEDLRIELLYIVDQLQLDLPYCETYAKKIARIKQAQEEILKKIQEEIPEKEEIEYEQSTAYALVKQGARTKNLGMAVGFKDEEALNKAYEEIYAKLEEFTGIDRAKELVLFGKDILTALDNSVEDNKAVRAALRKLGDKFVEVGMAMIVELGENPDDYFPPEVEPEVPEGENPEETPTPETPQEAKRDKKMAIMLAADEESTEDTPLPSTTSTLPDEMKNTLEETRKEIIEAFKIMDSDDMQDQLDSFIKDIMPQDPSDDEKDEEDEGEDKEENQGAYNPDTGEYETDPVIDGETMYHTVYPQSYEEALALIQSGVLDEKTAKLIALYFGIIDPYTEN